MSLEKYRSRVHMILLYPDNESHCNVLDKIKSSYDYAYCLHNKDVSEDGSFKKPHIHVVLRFKQAVWSSSVCSDLGLDLNFIEKARSFDNALQYLIHYNDSEKVQYDVNDVYGTLRSRLMESITKVEKSESEKVFDLIQYISDYDGKLTISAFASYCALNGYWSEFRRSGAIFVKIIDEHNALFSK